MELTQQQKEVFQRAAAICSRREKCSYDILTKLNQWELNEVDAEVVLMQLIEEKYIDDERYAHSFVRDKFRFNKWGKVKITHHLRLKQISPEVIQSALCEIDDSAYEETLQGLLSEKNKNIKAVNQYDRKAKLFRFVQARGFEMDAIYPLLDKIIQVD